ncbi:hypothetical protein ACFSX5_03020 [Devosia albogilva]|uniref:Uncharacterized protein n=1 Tax=Devosia albogilva TaxID=429726 RepID=A0ABW5QGM6_9HYPH
MKTLATASIAALVAIVGFSTLPVFATSDSDNTVHGFWEFSLQSSLRDRGVDASRVEEWGGLIRAFVQNPDGSTSMQLFDPTTLQPVSRG